MSFTNVNEQTKKTISDKKYKNIGKFSVTTPDRSRTDFEKAFSSEGAKSVLNPERRNKEVYFSEEIKSLREKNAAASGKIREKTEIGEKTEIINIPAVNNETVQLINALMHTQNHIVREITDVFDKRFERFDDIVMDLIRCKTENERLKNKVDNLTRDNYKLKKEVESFKTVIPGIYIKRDSDKTNF